MIMDDHDSELTQERLQWTENSSKTGEGRTIGQNGYGISVLGCERDFID